ncbi:MAG: efflux RND transporter periplasmic adaptor subunit [Ignavibacteriaceae bacterium]
MKKVMLIFPPVLLAIIAGCGNGNDSNKIEASGNIEATKVVVSAKVGGQIEKLNFIEGDKVRTNDTLLVIDSEALQIQLKQAEAARELAGAQLQLLRNGARKEDIQSAEAMKEQAKISLDQAKKDKERMDQLYVAKTISEKQHEDAVNRYSSMQQQYKSARENYDKLLKFARPEEIKQAMARVDQTIANENLVKKHIRDSYVVSPISGFVVKKYFEAGETVAPMSSLLKLSDLSKVKLLIYVSEKELGKVKLGQEADVTTDSYDGKKYGGKVIYISPEAEFTPKNIQTKDERTKLVFAVKIEIPNPNFELKPGMPADAVVHL